MAMENRIMVKATASGDCVYFKTVCRERKSPREFCFLRSELLKMRQKSFLVSKDMRSFAEIYRENNARVVIIFNWLDEDLYTGELKGWKQRVTLPLGTLLDFAERGGIGENPKKWTVLSLRDSFSPRIVFVDTENLKRVVNNLTVRHKLAKFLSRNFQYYNATEIRLFNDYEPYSFFFREICGNDNGMCGGVILHGRDDLKKAKYSIHT